MTLLDMAARATVTDEGTGRISGFKNEGHPSLLAKLRSSVELISNFVENLNREGRFRWSLDEAMC